MTGPAVEADDAGDDLEEEAAAAAEAPRQPRFDLDHGHQVRLVEALLFAAAEPLDAEAMRSRLPKDADLGAILADLAALYDVRGVTLVQVAGGWAFRTAGDLAAHLKVEVPAPKKLSRAALETLAIIAYHQPVTRAEIENIRGVATSKGTLDTLMEAGWIKPGRRKQSPGRPLTWVSTRAFLDHFGLAGLDDLPGVEELKAAGLLDARPAIATLPGGRLDEEGDDDGDDGEPEPDFLPDDPAED